MKTLLAIIAGVAIASPLSLLGGEGCCGAGDKEKSEQTDDAGENS